MFKAYFTEGRHLGDRATLKELGSDDGLLAAEVEALFQDEMFTREVRADEQVAYELGVTGVPFFALDRRLAVSGAQSAETSSRRCSRRGS